MKIKVLNDLRGATITADTGAIVWVDEAFGKALIAAGAAEEIIEVVEVVEEAVETVEEVVAVIEQPRNNGKFKKK